MAKPKPGQEKTYITWFEISKYVARIAAQIYDNDNINYIDYIRAIPRGGYIPAVMLSHQLKIPMVQATVEGTLIVDDITDTGDTLNSEVVKAYNRIYTATIFKRHNSNFDPNFVGYEIQSNKWLVFPWEDYKRYLTK